MGWKLSDAAILCVACNKILPWNKFDNETVATWGKLSTDDLYCRKCSGQGTAVNQADMIFCYGDCKQSLPDYHFVDAQLQAWRESGTLLNAKCAKCYARMILDIPADKTFDCQGACGKTKHIREFGPIAIKHECSHDGTR